MGFLTLFAKESTAKLVRLPSGSFTLDPAGNVMTSTLPRSFPEQYVREISQRVMDVFRAATKARIPLSEIIIQYAALKVMARELRGGAIIFLTPQGFQNNHRAPRQ